MDERDKAALFPLVKDEQWGLRLHQSDFAVNKVLAAASRRKARDFADIVAICEHMCPLGPLVDGGRRKASIVLPTEDRGANPLACAVDSR